MTAEADIYTVSDVTTGIKALLEDTFPRISISGEISNFKHHTSGHMYFSLKDTRSQLRCVMWRSSTKGLTFQPEDGMEVVAQGALTVYENQGQYQLVAKRLKPVGAGALQAAFEQLKTRLAEEGLFDEGNKQPLPAYPDCVGIVTSATGAAVRDIIQVLHRRAPWVTIILRSVPVQGEGAANEIATAIDEMNIFGGVDVLIVGRGGGSMEDLWAFNE
ncbi:MAG TPA: exodeoxyribonuclease VII large subunit, partial [Candidatus Latescibacteria bacterium]|nr:exodeoxyribonuclease VII large subunit [Candidatus Latescibacterota bacterium]